MVTVINIDMTPPACLPPEGRDAFLAVASHCTVHNTLATPPTTAITLTEAASASSGGPG
ncbi:hypothetical protein SAMN04515671_4364 [Nakamurella panacisegetis]|uniref:OsmC-like protein n=1 Tax=Nakamurella panacisegetis TaxID=1090615 RepID=A0A1H0SZA2_9ACTN|nr:hypothetical protein [Nakamurella panacisegetis]SDP46850.1 hypothetical protein SAMN04515671_4364 [Nakamurella panacisegetis]